MDVHQGTCTTTVDSITAAQEDATDCTKSLRQKLRRAHRLSLSETNRTAVPATDGTHRLEQASSRYRKSRNGDVRSLRGRPQNCTSTALPPILPGVRDSTTRDVLRLCPPPTLTLRALLNLKRLLQPLFRYLHETGRFRGLLGDVRLKASAQAERRP